MYARHTFRRQRDNDGDMTSSSAAATGRRQSPLSKRRVTRMVIVVVAVFAVCWLPLHVVFVIQYSSTSTSTWLVVVKIPCTCLAYVNSCLNPFLYAFLSHNFQRSVARRLCPASQQGARDCTPLRLHRRCCLIFTARQHTDARY